MHILQLYACGKCGDCILACPVFEETQDETLAPAFKIRALKSLAKARYGIRALLFGPRRVNSDHVQKLVSSIYNCTMCGRCMTVCPFNFDLIDLWEKARERAVESGFGLPQVLQIKDVVEAEKNVYNLPNSSRREWLEFEQVEAPKKEKADTVYFVGCTTSYSGILTPIAHAVTSIMDAVGEDWTLLDEEWCCGSPLRFAGTTGRYREFVAKHVEAIEALDAKRVVVNCPSCYRRLKYDYPRIIGRPLRFHVIHFVELVDEYVKEDRLTPVQKLEATVTYHDPCELSRLSGIYDEPRRLLTKFVTNFVEMPENKVNTRCCGAGGLLKTVNPELSSSLAKKRVEQAEKVGASIIVSACPACKLHLTHATIDKKSEIQVLDIAEVIAQQLGLIMI